jgi:uncharacterized protein with FMN-binding domain
VRRAVAASLGAAVVAVPPAGAAAAVAKTAQAAATPKKTVVVKTVSGSAVEADRWGTVRVTLKVRRTTLVVNGVRKVTRRWFDIGGTFTYHTDRSLYIMQQALPRLRQQALRTHSARVDIISGATYTSQAFITSLQQAILKANQV